MALATKPKRTTSHRRRSGEHHRHNKPYLKTYWPYLPMLLIVAAGTAIDHLWSVGSSIAVQPSQVINPQFASTVQPASRLQVLTGNHDSWLVSLVIVLSVAAFALFLVRHSHRLHRSIIKGEAFVSHHPWLDVSLVLIFTAGFILTRPGGFIG